MPSQRLVVRVRAGGRWVVRCGACILSLTSCYTFCGIRIRLIYLFHDIAFFHPDICGTFSLRIFESWNDYRAIYFLTYALSRSWLSKKSSRNAVAYLSKACFAIAVFGIQARCLVNPRCCCTCS